MIDHYLAALTQSCTKLESVYNIDGASTLKVDKFIYNMKTALKSMPSSVLQDKYVQAFPVVGTFAHLACRMEFEDVLVLDFSGFPHKDEVGEALEIFSYKANLTKKKQADAANQIGQVLLYIDQKRVDLRYELPYRILRLLLVLVVHTDYYGAAMLALLLSTQMGRS